MSQVNLAYLHYQEALADFDTANQLVRINQDLEHHRKVKSRHVNLGGLDLIQVELDGLLAQLEKDIQYSRIQSALNLLALYVGENMYGDVTGYRDVSELAALLEKRERKWFERNRLGKFE